MQSVAAAKAPLSATVFAESPASCVGFFFCWALFFPGALMGGGHIRYSRTVQYGTLRMYAEQPPPVRDAFLQDLEEQKRTKYKINVRDAPGRYSPLPES